MNFYDDYSHEPAGSYQQLYRNIEYWVQQKEQLTNVPKENAYEAAEQTDEETSFE
ncbi:hypothetical protein [Paenibacillus turpanensis]|uniref:hypothetical protein n=1 Tax=Paenibacillus turpanensis TaxID=2689078 RepID=UPI00140C2284|nr:hypothetical protein [Paenibacillus turpanensis]